MLNDQSVLRSAVVRRSLENRSFELHAETQAVRSLMEEAQQESRQVPPRRVDYSSFNQQAIEDYNTGFYSRVFNGMHPPAVELLEAVGQKMWIAFNYGPIELDGVGEVISRTPWMLRIGKVTSYKQGKLLVQRYPDSISSAYVVEVINATGGI